MRRRCVRTHAAAAGGAFFRQLIWKACILAPYIGVLTLQLRQSASDPLTECDMASLREHLQQSYVFAVLVVLRLGAVDSHLAPTVSVTPAPCDGFNRSDCPYYWNSRQDTFYRVFVNNEESFVYQGLDPPECTGGYKAQPGHCASHWNVQSQSYTMVSATFGNADVTVDIRVETSHGRLAGKSFINPRVVAGFGKGNPTEKSSASGEYIFTVASAGHYSVELFGQGAGLRDALLIFVDETSDDTAQECQAPVGSGKLYRFTGPNVSNPTNPSWKNTGYYAFDRMIVGAGDVVCLERGAWVEGHLTQDPKLGCSGHGIAVVGAGVWSGQAIVGKTPADDRRPLIQLCGANITVSGITVANSLAANVELSPYWYKGYWEVVPGEMQALRGGNHIDNVKALSTWWYSTDGLYAGYVLLLP